MAAKGFDRLPKTINSIREFSALKAVVLLLVGAVLYVGHAAFIPIAMALLLALILSGPVELLHRAGVARSISALLILMSTLGLIIGLVAMLWAPMQDWYAAAPKTLATIQRKVTPVARIVNRLEDLTHRAGSVAIADPGDRAKAQATVVANALSPADWVAYIRDALVGVVAFVIMTLFLLVGGPPMVARMTAAFFDHLKANHIQRYIEKVRAEVGRYYVTTTLINLGLGLATGVVMALWGMPTPYIWGTLAALLNYLPYIGPATTLLMITIVGLVSFDGIGSTLGVALSFLALTTLEGQVIQPLLVGRRLEVNPLLIFLGLWFGGFFWGIAGVILATPVLLALKVIAENSPFGETMLEFLGPNAATAADTAVSPNPYLRAAEP